MWPSASLAFLHPHAIHVQAKDGVCDEGRVSLSGPPDRPAAPVFCDLGTDCGDCGPWRGHLPMW